MSDTPALPAASPDRWLIAAVLVFAAARAMIAGKIGLSDDEAYYRMWALAPALSYLDHPPMVAYMIALGRGLLGDTVLGIRAVTIVSFVVGTAVLWRTTRILYGAAIANSACWFAIAMPLLAIGSVITTPDAPSVLFSGLAMWGLAELHRSQNANWWLAVGLFAGLGLLSKYTNLFVGCAILIWVLTNAERRTWLRTWQFWSAGVIAAALAMPIIIWNTKHGWASFAKQFGRVVRGDEATALYLAEMGGGYLALASPVIAVLAICGLVSVVLRAIRTRESAPTLLAASILPVLLYFSIHALHARVQANWLAPLYPPLAICAALGLAAITGSKRKSLTAMAAVATGFASIAAVYAHALAPLPLPALRKDPTDQLRGWPEFSENVEALRIAQGAEWIATSSYTTTAQLAFALKAHAKVFQLNDPLRYVHLEAAPVSSTQSHGIYVELDRRADEALLRQHFHSVDRLGDIERALNGRTVAAYAVYRVSDPMDAALTGIHAIPPR